MATAEAIGTGAQIGGISSASWRITDDDIETMAQICHEANRALCTASGDLSQPSWADAPDWQKESARAGVHFHIENPYAQPEASHDQWLERKLREGWKYGPVKNVNAKEHPCCLPFHALSETDKLKDSVFSSIVKGYVDGLRKARQ